LSSWEGSEHPEERFMKAEDVALAVWNIYALSPSTVEELLATDEGDIEKKIEI
jgi:hypothetical protein